MSINHEQFIELRKLLITSNHEAFNNYIMKLRKLGHAIPEPKAVISSLIYAAAFFIISMEMELKERAVIKFDHSVISNLLLIYLELIGKEEDEKQRKSNEAN
jgi:hypothetical protein